MDIVIKKILKSIFIIFTISMIIVSVVTSKKNIFDFSNLKLDQQNAYISLSRNNVEGYNRWIPFYFSYYEEVDMDSSEVEEVLNENVKYANLYAGSEVIYSTERLVWSSCEVTNGNYNLTLVLIPELKEFMFKGIKVITHIELVSSTNEFQKYKLPNYIVEQRMTIDNEEFDISLSSMESDISENFIARANYGIAKKQNEITEIELDYPKDFLNVKNYKIVDIAESGDGNVVYSFDVQLTENSSKTIFRPFLKIEYNNGKLGYLIPAVPVYFR